MEALEGLAKVTPAYPCHLHVTQLVLLRVEWSISLRSNFEAVKVDVCDDL